MSRDGNEADISVTLADRLEVGLDDAETGELSLSSRVGLERDGFVPGDETEVVLELLRWPKADDKSQQSTH
jgi:hypothetical protein